MNSVLAMTPPKSLAVMKPKTASEKKTGTTLDTLEFTPEMIAKFKLPSGQRPLRENNKVRELAMQIKADGGVIPGIITLGKMDGSYYIIDGQHRLHAFLMSCEPKGYADCRLLHTDNMQDINREFVELNSRLTQMRPDDFLRGMEDSTPTLQTVRKLCPYVGYDLVRKSACTGPIVSMSSILRTWRSSAMESPGSVSQTAQELAIDMVEADTAQLTDFLALAHDAFGRDVEFRVLWGSLNLGLCMWLYRHMVLTQYSPKTPKLDKVTFKKCLMALSADSTYLDWLVGRRLGERDRSPAYSRLKALFASRLAIELGRKVALPAPDWSN